MASVPAKLAALFASKARRPPWLLLALAPVALAGSCVLVGILSDVVSRAHEAERVEPRCVDHPLDPGCERSAVSPPHEEVTLEKYNELRTTMTLEHVTQMLGQGEEKSRNRLGGTTTVVYEWKTHACCGAILLVFQDGALLQKSQSGLQ